TASSALLSNHKNGVSFCISFYSELPSAEGGDDMNLIAWSERCGQVPRRVLVDVDRDVRPDRVLLGDDAKAKAAIAAVKVRQDVTEGRAVRLDFMLLPCVGAKRTGDQNLHRDNSTASREQISRTCLTREPHCCPSVRLPQISPAVVPKYSPTGL